MLLLLLEFLALMPTQTINRGKNKCVLFLNAVTVLSQISLTINNHVHIEGKQSNAAVAPGVDRADISPVVTVLDPWQFGHSACV